MKTLQFDFILIAKSQIAHHERNEGNVGQLKRSACVLPNGEIREIPEVSGNSMRHGLREAMVNLTLDALGLLDGGRHFDAPDMVRFLFNGGAGSGDGNTVKLDDVRAMRQLVPSTGILGGSSRGMIHEGRLEVAPAELLCSERMHEIAQWQSEELASRGFEVKPSVTYETTVTEYRRDVTESVEGQFLLTEAALALVNDRRGKRERASDDDDEAAASESKGGNMPHGSEVVIKGSLWTWSVVARCCTELDELTVRAGLSAFLRRMVVGSGKRVARGRFEIWAARGIDHLKPAEAARAMTIGELAGVEYEDPYVAHVRERAEEAKTWLGAK